MKEEDLHWLLRCADRLNAAVVPPIDIEGLIIALGIKLNKVNTSSTRAGIATRSKGGGYEITIYPHRSHHRERFTLAHELAHVLIEERLAWHPTSRREYFVREEWCNRFANRLLVPERLVRKCKVDQPSAAFRSVLWISNSCTVSKEVAARRLATAYPGFGMAELNSQLQSSKGVVTQIAWAAPEAPELGLRRHKILREGHPITDAISARSTEGRKMSVSLQSGEGIAYRSKRVPTRYLLWYVTETIGTHFGVASTGVA